MTTTSMLPYLAKRSEMWFVVMRRTSCGNDVVSLLWCSVAMERAVGSSSTSMCCRICTCCCRIASADMFAPEHRFSDTSPVVWLACTCFTDWDTCCSQALIRVFAFCLVRAAAIGDAVFALLELALATRVAQRVSCCALARVSRGLAAPAVVCVCLAHWRLECSCPVLVLCGD